MRTVWQIVKDAGGPTAVSSAAMRSKKFKKIKAKSVYDFNRVGISEHHWPLIMSLTETTPHELHEANKRLRAARGRRAQEEKAA